MTGAVRSLLARGDLELALQLSEVALARHPGNAPLATARAEALQRLRAQHQFNPFKLIIYTERAGRELPPVEAPAAGRTVSAR